MQDLRFSAETCKIGERWVKDARKKIRPFIPVVNWEMGCYSTSWKHLVNGHQVIEYLDLTVVNVLVGVLLARFEILQYIVRGLSESNFNPVEVLLY